jgi:hypothetical protein
MDFNKNTLEIENERLSYVGFKLLKLELTNFPPFGNVSYDFCDQEDKQDNIYNTIVIGPNGTRKSLLFNLLIYIFKSIEELKKNLEVNYKDFPNGNFGMYSKGDYYLKYVLNQEIHEIRRVHGDEHGHNNYGYSFHLNYSKKVSPEKFELPSKIIGNSINITDKFPQYKQKEYDRFQYLGIKYNPQSASTKAYLKKTVDFISELSSSDSFLKGINLIATTFSGKDNKIRITYKTVNTAKFFKGKLKLSDLDTFFGDMEKRYLEKGKQAPFMLNRFKSLHSTSKGLLGEAVEYCNKLFSTGQLNDIRKSSIKILRYDLSDTEGLEQLSKNGQYLSVLYKIGMLRDLNIEIVPKNGENYTLENSSSGEHNLITSLIGLLATIKPHCLVFIDEPEISLHPNWQMRYLSFFNQLFGSEAYNTCHAVFATHSHFLISDLKSENSKIIGLRPKEGGIETIKFSKETSTYGWSAEEVLLKIFKVPTSRNYFLDHKIGVILQLMAIPDSDNAIIVQSIRELKELNIQLSKEDPLREILELLYKKIERA